jgi:hypothetical protein
MNWNPVARYKVMRFKPCFSPYLPGVYSGQKSIDIYNTLICNILKKPAKKLINDNLTDETDHRSVLGGTFTFP